jgi:hypothetical protein
MGKSHIFGVILGLIRVTWSFFSLVLGIRFNRIIRLTIDPNVLVAEMYWKR